MERKRNVPLKHEHRAYIVRLLACFHTPTEVCVAFNEEFGFELTPNRVQAYDPTKAQSKNLSKQWRELFAKTREEYRKSEKDFVPGANKVHRLRKLQKAADEFERRRNFVAMARMYEQIAKECGGSFQNLQKIEHTGKDGGPIKSEDVTGMTQEQIKAEIMLLLGVDPARVTPGPETRQ